MAEEEGEERDSDRQLRSHESNRSEQIDDWRKLHEKRLRWRLIQELTKCSYVSNVTLALSSIRDEKEEESTLKKVLLILSFASSVC